MEYEDFFLQIGPLTDGLYAVSVQSPAGEGSGRFEIPPLLRSPVVTAGEERSVLRNLWVSQDPSPLSQPAIGTALFSALLTGQILTLFHGSLSISQAAGRGLRIRLRLDPREPECAPLHALPWELLCRPDTGDFLALSRSTPVVRFLDANRPVPRVLRPPRLRILVVVSMPSDLAFLDVREELRDLEAAWEGQEAEVVRLGRADRKELREALLTGPFHVLHFLGHGMVEGDGGKLFFEQPSGAAQAVDGRDLAIELKDFKDLRLIILNACETASTAENGTDPMAGVANALVLGGIPAVVAMRSPISDRAALVFARTLSERLATGDPVDAAVVEGRLAIYRLDEVSEEWATPALFLRGPDGSLFNEVRSARPARQIGLIAGILGMTAALLLFWLVVARGSIAASSKALVRNNQGVALAADGRDSEAREAFIEALAIDPRYGAALSNLSAVEERSGDLEAALRHAQQAVASWPEDAVLHFNLGNLLSRLGWEEEALASLGRAVELEPSYAEARNELGMVYLRLERPGDAWREFKAGLRVRPDLAPLHKNLARAALAEGKNKEAIEHLKRALILYGVTDPQGSAEATYWIAVVLAKEGRPAEACERLERLTPLVPSQVAEWALDIARLAREEKCGQ